MNFSIKQEHLYIHSIHYYSYTLELIVQDKMQLPFYEYTWLECIKMAILSLLYILEKWCESNISGQVYILYITKYLLLYC